MFFVVGGGGIVHPSILISFYIDFAFEMATVEFLHAGKFFVWLQGLSTETLQNWLSTMVMTIDFC